MFVKVSVDDLEKKLKKAIETKNEVDIKDYVFSSLKYNLQQKYGDKIPVAIEKALDEIEKKSGVEVIKNG